MKKVEQRFEIIARIAQGGMAEIFLVYDKRRSEELALKKLLEQHCRSRKIIKMFYQEARLLASLNHPNILKVYEAGKDNQRPFVLMEYFKSRPLKDYIKKEFDMINTVDILYQVGLALDYIHGSGIIHLDIKPANILVDDVLKVKLADFGLATTVVREKFRFRRPMGGTPSYMSPEQISGRRVDRRSDIYSFGVMAYEFLTGKLPFSGENLNELLAKHVGKVSAKRPSEFVDNIPPLFDEIILKCLEKDKNNRYQDMTHVLLDISRSRSRIRKK